MSRSGPIVIIENDADECEFMEAAYARLGLKNKLLHFSTAQAAFDYLLNCRDQPFIIISEVQFPGMDGIRLRKKILENDYLREKSIPFVYFTGDLKREELVAAYALQVQGYFLKKYTIDEIERMLRKIIDYWMECEHPNAQ